MNDPPAEVRVKRCEASSLGAAPLGKSRGGMSYFPWQAEYPCGPEDFKNILCEFNEFAHVGIGLGQSLYPLMRRSRQDRRDERRSHLQEYVILLQQ